jgi:Fe-S cluster biosynthesis and repair protein YggX
MDENQKLTKVVNCIKYKKELEALDRAPLPGELGKKILAQVSKQAWSDWLKHQTMLINENKLNMSDLRARQYLTRQLDKYFFGDGQVDRVAGYVEPKNPS